MTCATAVAVANAFEEKILDSVKAMCGLCFSELISGSKALVFRFTDLFQELKAPKTDSTVGQHIVDVRGQDMMVAVEFAAALCSTFDFASGLHSAFTCKWISLHRIQSL